ncbi:MAG: hypothetical protein ACTSV7_14945 [Candidatus Baldrarchaeia archaeon]
MKTFLFFTVLSLVWLIFVYFLLFFAQEAAHEASAKYFGIEAEIKYIFGFPLATIYSTKQFGELPQETKQTIMLMNSINEYFSYQFIMIATALFGYTFIIIAAIFFMISDLEGVIRRCKS